MTYRLALDLGPTSLGWAILRLNAAGEVVAIIRIGVRIFSDGRSPKDGSSLAAGRRDARAMRRRRDRLLGRKRQMMAVLIKRGFFPKDETARKELERLNPYELRAKGLDAALTPAEFARALFHLNQRRGFQSNRRADRKTDRKDSDSGVLKQTVSTLRTQLHESGCRTVGEWLWKVRMQERPEGVAGQGVRARYRKTPCTTAKGKSSTDKRYDLYVERAMVLQEFDALWTAQQVFNPALLNNEARDELHRILAFQNPLRPVSPGRCTLIPEAPRAPKALPSAQRFRIYQEVNHLRVLHDDLREEPLTLTQRDQIVELLEQQDQVTFTAMCKTLGLCAKFNLEDKKRRGLKGNATAAALSTADRFGEAWARFDAVLQDEIVWQLITEESEECLITWLQENTDVDEAHARAIANANASLPEGYGSLSRPALARILPALQREVITYDKAVQAAGFAHHSDLGLSFEYEAHEVEKIGVHPTQEAKPVFAFKQLPYYGRALQRHVAFGSGKPQDPEEKRYGKISNPTVHIGLNQVRKVVNALIRRYGRPAEVVIELARELRQNLEQRRQTQRRQADNQKRNARICASVAEVLNISEARVRGADIQKWLLWEELNDDEAKRCCPYSGVPIDRDMLLSDQVEVEHILPRSKTQDNGLSNKTVALL